MEPNKDYFLRIAEAYITQDPDSKDHVTKIMLAKGILIDMESDIVFFENSKGETDKSISQKQRLAILKSAVNTFAEVSSNNLQIGYILYKYHSMLNKENDIIHQLESRIVDLEEQLKF